LRLGVSVHSSQPSPGYLATSPETYGWSSHARYLKPTSASSWLRVREALEYFGTPRTFHECAVAGNEEALEAFYAAKRQLPVLGTEGFLGWVKNKGQRLSREHPRYERVTGRPSVRQVMQRVAMVFEVEVTTLMSGRRGETNHARKAAMYLVELLCDLTLQETAVHVGMESYGVVGWTCAQVRAKQAADQRSKKRVSQVEAEISQQKFCPLF